MRRQKDLPKLKRREKKLASVQLRLENKYNRDIYLLNKNYWIWFKKIVK